MHSPIFVKQKHTLFIAKSQWLHQHRIPLASVKTFAKNENYFQIRSPKITALLCPFPALSHAETPRFSRNCVESTIVGYNGSALDEDGGAVVTGPQFIDVGGGSFYLTNLVFVSEADTAWNVEIQTLNNWGGTGDEDYTWTGAGWEDADGNPATDVTLAPGKGLWVYNFSGEAIGFHIPAPEL